MQKQQKYWIGKSALKLFPDWRHESIVKEEISPLANSSDKVGKLSLDIVCSPKDNFKLIVKQIMVYPFFSNYYEAIMFIWDVKLPGVDLILLFNPINNQIQISQLTPNFLKEEILQNQNLKIQDLFPNFYEKINYQ